MVYLSLDSFFYSDLGDGGECESEVAVCVRESDWNFGSSWVPQMRKVVRKRGLDESTAINLDP